MAVKALATAWRVLAGLYRLPGQSSAPSEIELDLPVQPVHDLSRQAEVARGAYVELETTIVVAAANTTSRSALTFPALLFQTQVLAALQQISLSEGQVDVWVVAQQIVVDPATFLNLDFCASGVIFGGATFVGTQSWILNVATDPLLTQPIIAGEDLIGQASFGLSDNATKYIRTLPLPLRLPRAAGTSLVFMADSAAGGGVTVAWQTLLWIGPTGTRPPAVA